MLERGRDFIRGGSKLDWLPAQYRGYGLVSGSGSERGRSRYHLMKHHAQTPNVCPCVHRHFAQLFRRHVVHRADSHSRLSLHFVDRGRFVDVIQFRGPFVELGDAKVQYFDVAVCAQHDVFGLDITMDDPGGVCCFQGPRNLSREIQGLQ